MIAEITGLSEALKMANGLAKQARYATSQALNDTALAIQRNTLDTLLPRKFTLRSKGAPWQKPGNKLGFNIKFAKRDNLESRIGSAASWLKLQEECGTKTPARITRKISEMPGMSGYKVAIPTTFWKPKQDILTAAKKPSRILKSTAAQPIKRSGGNKKPTPFVWMRTAGAAIFIRTGKDRLPIRPLFFLKYGTKIKPVLNFVKNGTAIASETFGAQFAKRFSAAISSAR